MGRQMAGRLWEHLRGTCKITMPNLADADRLERLTA